jgi:ADP-L-glycero-D-manno-heptose 6-epimerase
MASVVLHAFDQIQKNGTATLFRSHRAGIADGEQKRDFIAVEDVVNVLFFALEKPIRRGIFNLGTGKARSFLDLVRATFKGLNLPERIQWVDTPIELRERYQYFTQAEMQRLRSEGYLNPFLTLEEGVSKYIKRLH